MKWKPWIYSYTDVRILYYYFLFLFLDFFLLLLPNKNSFVTFGNGVTSTHAVKILIVERAAGRAAQIVFFIKNNKCYNVA